MILQAALIVLSLAAIAQGERRIIGGHNAPNHKYPYLISFRHKGKHFCGGSILNKRWILTAAHCFKDPDVNLFTISAGTNYFLESGTVYEPKLLITHEKYKSHSYFHDIALVRLKKDIVFTDFVKPIDLATEDLQDDSRTFIFAGWGRLWSGGYTPNKLQEIRLNFLAIEECRKTFPSVTKLQFCTKNKRGEGACHGDSGGPLVVDGVQVGISSFGRNPCGNYPEVWTRVFAYQDWIIENIKRYESKNE